MPASPSRQSATFSCSSTVSARASAAPKGGGGSWLIALLGGDGAETGEGGCGGTLVAQLGEALTGLFEVGGGVCGFAG